MPKIAPHASFSCFAFYVFWSNTQISKQTWEKNKALKICSSLVMRGWSSLDLDGGSLCSNQRIYVTYLCHNWIAYLFAVHVLDAKLVGSGRVHWCGATIFIIGRAYYIVHCLLYKLCAVSWKMVSQVTMLKLFGSWWSTFALNLYIGSEKTASAEEFINHKFLKINTQFPLYMTQPRTFQNETRRPKI